VIVERGTAFDVDLRSFTKHIRFVETTEMSSPPASIPWSGRTRCRLAAAVALVAVALAVAPTPILKAEGEPESIDILFAPYGIIRWQRGERPVLLVYPERGDGWINLARSFTDGTGKASALRQANPGLKVPIRDRHVRVPVEILRDDLRLEAVRRLFPADRRIEAGWEHWVLDPFEGGEESWQWLAELFSGREDGQRELRRANPERAAQGLQRGRTVFVPVALLLPVFRSIPPVATATPAVTATPITTSTPLVAETGPMPTPTPFPPVGVAAGPLTYGSDGRGDYAVYQLRKGEALYSAVVVRFTGQLLAKQVNETAMEIAARSGIDDVTDIPVGFPVKIPLDLLLPEYLPAENPRRLAWVAEQRDLGRFLEVVNATDLSGVQVILDAGHGGHDTGALVGGLWESAYAYDLMCRIKVNLEKHTRATVWTTIQQKGHGYSVPPVDRLEHRRDAFLLTRPPYTLEDSVLGVHLRWYLTNDIILNRLSPGFPRSKTVFLSVHADSLHPSVRGAMVYVPSRYLRPSKFTVDRRELRKYAEYRNHPTIQLGTDFKARVEASSRHLADNIVRSLSENGIGVHPYEPVRDRVLRGRSTFVPAVLRFTAAQNAILLEACNMANPEDRALLQKAAWREQFARAVVEGMASAFKN
jgi:N-acetylmuramoyl-L-alanine amidase